MDEKILVIDDEPLILMTIEKALTKTGYRVKTTTDVKVFRDELLTGGVDLAIMDLHMKGINTSNLLEEIKETSSRTKVLVISGSVVGPAERNFLQKPFKIDDLRGRVREILDTAG